MASIVDITLRIVQQQHCIDTDPLPMKLIHGNPIQLKNSMHNNKSKMTGMIEIALRNVDRP